MPRLVFGNKDQMLRWMRMRVDPERYDLYVTDEREFILVPRKSTQPIMFGYFKLTDEDVEQFAGEIKALSVPVFRVKGFEWDTRKAVGIKIPIE